MAREYHIEGLDEGKWKKVIVVKVNANMLEDFTYDVIADSVRQMKKTIEKDGAYEAVRIGVKIGKGGMYR